MDQVVVGSIESNDIMIKVVKGMGIEVELESSLQKQFGTDIINTIKEVLKELNVDNIKVMAFDKGALDFTIRARVKTAVRMYIEKFV